MATLEDWTLWIHIAAGVVAVAAGAGAIATTKGGRRHRFAGRAFVRSMAVVVVTVFALLAVAPSAFRVFLALVAVFSGYLAFSGYRALSRKRPSDDAHAVDWTAATGVVVACLALGGWGVVRLADGDAFGAVMGVFGAIGVGFGVADARSFRAAEGHGKWRVAHLQRMLGAFVATVSAVSAVNLTPALGVLAWLWPTIAGVPVIAYYSRAYSRSP